MTTECERPGTQPGPSTTPSTDQTADQTAGRGINHTESDCYSATAAWCANFERMAAKAARSPEFYDISGAGVQARADEIRAGGAA